MRITAVSLAFLDMCGRFLLTTPVESLGRLFGFPERPNLAPRYNIAPTQEVAVLRCDAESGGRRLTFLRWGLVPFWAEDPVIGQRMINARAETLAEKPAFRAAFRHRRCLILADGFYEWQKSQSGEKQPQVIRRADGAPFAFAGLWESWEDRVRGAALESCGIVTTEANDLLRPIHHRMPVVLESESAAMKWLALDSEQDDLQRLLQPAAITGWAAYPVSTRVNKVANDDASLLMRLEKGAGKTEGTGPESGSPQGSLF